MLTNNFTLENSKEYFDGLRQKIISEDLTQIIFKQSNEFFLTDLQRGFDPNQTNKMNSGFNYRLKMPVQPGTSRNEQLKAEVNVLDLNAIRIQPFK